MEEQSPISSPRRIGFYPCCCGDIEEPRRFLAPLVDEIIFCDLRRAKNWAMIQDDSALPKATFLKGDVNTVIENLPLFKVLFYRNDSDGEGGSGQHILGPDLLPRILRRFDPTGGWIFSDGSNDPDHFKSLLSKEWLPKPDYGYEFRQVDGFALRNRHGNQLHAIEVRPITASQIKTQTDSVLTSVQNMNSFDALWGYCTSNNRLVPMPDPWNKLYNLLKNTRQKPSGGWEPPLPLILASWQHSTPIEKQLRFKAHLEWAQTQGQLEEVGDYLYSLMESQWCHFGEI